MKFAAKIQEVHYGWIIVATGMLVLFSCLGLARFAYAMLLPGMQAALGLPYERMGFIGTANFIGYLTAVFLAPTFISRFRPHPTIAAALLLIAFSMFGVSCSGSFYLIAFLYTLTGIGTGFANIPMMVLLTYWFRSEQRGKAAGIVIAGNGVGIIFAGFLIPLLNRIFGDNGWRLGWLAIGGIALVTAVCAMLLLRSHPSDLGLEPVGRPRPASPDPMEPLYKPAAGSILVRLGILYLVFGVTFMIYGTFIVTTMVREYGFSEQQAGFYWSWVGFFSLFSGVGFGALSDTIGRKRGLALVFAVQTMAYLLAGLKLGSVALMASIVLYGLAVFAIPTIMAAAVGDYVGISRAASAFTTITLFFATGQAIGPGSAGLIAGATGRFTLTYLVASLLTAGAAVLALTLPSPSDTPS